MSISRGDLIFWQKNKSFQRIFNTFALKLKDLDGWTWLSAPCGCMFEARSSSHVLPFVKAKEPPKSLTHFQFSLLGPSLFWCVCSCLWENRSFRCVVLTGHAGRAAGGLFSSPLMRSWSQIFRQIFLCWLRSGRFLMVVIVAVPELLVSAPNPASRPPEQGLDIFILLALDGAVCWKASNLDGIIREEQKNLCFTVSILLPSSSCEWDGVSASEGVDV